MKQEPVWLADKRPARTADNQLLSGELRTALRHRRGGVRLATLDPTGQRPWKVGPALRQVHQGMLTPLVLGDTMLFYREGAWPAPGDCDDSNPGTYPAMYRVLNISADGRLLLVLQHGGLVLYDVDADSTTPVKGMGSDNTLASACTEGGRRSSCAAARPKEEQEVTGFQSRLTGTSAARPGFSGQQAELAHQGQVGRHRPAASAPARPLRAYEPESTLLGVVAVERTAGGLRGGTPYGGPGL